MAKTRADRIAKAGELYTNLIKKVWKVKLGLVAAQKAVVEMKWPTRQDFGIDIEGWKRLHWITGGHAKLAAELRDALTQYLESGEPISEQGLWQVSAGILNADEILITVETFETIIEEVEHRYGRQTKNQATTFAYHVMVGMEAHERD